MLQLEDKYWNIEKSGGFLYNYFGIRFRISFRESNRAILELENYSCIGVMAVFELSELGSGLIMCSPYLYHSSI